MVCGAGARDPRGQPALRSPRGGGIARSADQVGLGTANPPLPGGGWTVPAQHSPPLRGRSSSFPLASTAALHCAGIRPPTTEHWQTMARATCGFPAPRQTATPGWELSGAAPFSPGVRSLPRLSGTVVLPRGWRAVMGNLQRSPQFRATPGRACVVSSAKPSMESRTRHTPSLTQQAEARVRSLGNEGRVLAFTPEFG